jgi:hypothetical protein
MWVDWKSAVFLCHLNHLPTARPKMPKKEELEEPEEELEEDVDEYI